MPNKCWTDCSRSSTQNNKNTLAWKQINTNKYIIKELDSKSYVPWVDSNSLHNSLSLFLESFVLKHKRRKKRKKKNPCHLDLSPLPTCFRDKKAVNSHVLLCLHTSAKQLKGGTNTPSPTHASFKSHVLKKNHSNHLSSSFPHGRTCGCTYASNLG